MLTLSDVVYFLQNRNLDDKVVFIKLPYNELISNSKVFTSHINTFHKASDLFAFKCLQKKRFLVTLDNSFEIDISAVEFNLCG